jgi:phosphoribosylformylglycinamidine cyclo-ligase
LIGGETAEMPGHYTPGSYDLAGFTVGIAERHEIIDGTEIKAGDKLIGLASSGIHSNGYSLVRKICFEELGLSVTDQVPELGSTLGEALLKPTRIYTESVLNVIKNFHIQGVVHITGGGFTDNIPRVLPSGCKAVIKEDSWPRQAIFDFLQKRGNVSTEDMFRTFNCGIGMILIVKAKEVDDIMGQLAALAEDPYLIGEIASVKDADDDKVEIV